MEVEPSRRDGVGAGPVAGVLVGRQFGGVFGGDDVCVSVGRGLRHAGGSFLRRASVDGGGFKDEDEL